MPLLVIIGCYSAYDLIQLRSLLQTDQEERIWEISTKLDFALSELSVEGDFKKLHRIIMLTAGLPDVKDVVVVGPDNKVLESAGTQLIGAGLDNAFLVDLRQAFKQAEKTGRAQILRDVVQGQSFVYSVIPVRGGTFGTERGYGVVLIDTSGAKKKFRSTLVRQMVLAFLVVLSLGLSIMWVMHRQVVKPIDRISRAARKSLGDGHYVSSVELPHNELRDLDKTLADTFNQLAATRSDLVERTEDLEHHNQAMRDFTHIASHDLKEPLRKIQMFSDRIKRRHLDELPEDVMQDFQRMSSAANRLQNLIQDIMDYTRLASIEEQSEEIELDVMIAEILEDLSLLMRENDAVVRYEGLGRVQGVRVLLKQLFQNLILNALKYRRETISPSIDIVRERVGLVTRISVRDNGIGFDPKYAEKIFGVFERLHGRGTFEGTGIGLAICMRIALLHNGSIQAEGRPDEGAIFTVVLPHTDLPSKADE